MVAARDGTDTVKVELAARFQQAVDEAAMRLCEEASMDYLAGWRRGDWQQADGSAKDLVTRVAEELSAAWPTARLQVYLDTCGAGPR